MVTKGAATNSCREKRAETYKCKTKQKINNSLTYQGDGPLSTIKMGANLLALYHHTPRDFNKYFCFSSKHQNLSAGKKFGYYLIQCVTYFCSFFFQNKAKEIKAQEDEVNCPRSYSKFEIRASTQVLKIPVKAFFQCCFHVFSIPDLFS